jgi:multiple antibiotic resistance protein
MHAFLLCFVPLFAAVDVVGLLPVFLGLTEGIDQRAQRKIIIQSMITALLVACVFLAVGELVLRLLGITLSDFMIAGGLLLFGISLTGLIMGEKTLHGIDAEVLGSVPVGVPLMVGPAVLTTSLLLLRQYGPLPTVSSLVVNIVIAGCVLWFSGAITRLIGKTGAKTVSKIASLLLAAIGIMLVRKGIMLLFVR